MSRGIALNERLLFIFVELARNDVWFVIFETQTMQKRDQSRAAFINEAEFLFDPGAKLARRVGQRRTGRGASNPCRATCELLGAKV